ncbi:histidine phosphatase family protein [Desulfarculus baarsii]|uniref:histidine phosphatase family protein n=1 Tax=Desulfarculus baarsii TaxID=453230 RepID=UPI0002D9A53B|nr:histidine phosphatase family protein [Desulfarculus baarsii]
MPAFEQIVADHRGGEFRVVSHSGVNRILLTRMLGAPLERIFRIDQDFACLNVVDIFNDGTPLVRRINDLMEDPAWLKHRGAFRP